jgi:hypothetical protein
MRNHVRTLWYGELPNAIARLLAFCYIFIKNKVKALNTLLNSSTVGLNVTTASQVVVYASAKRAEKLLLFLLFSYLLIDLDLLADGRQGSVNQKNAHMPCGSRISISYKCYKYAKLKPIP